MLVVNGFVNCYLYCRMYQASGTAPLPCISGSRAAFDGQGKCGHSWAWFLVTNGAMYFSWFTDKV
jgi:hypothetical protein